IGKNTFARQTRFFWMGYYGTAFGALFAITPLGWLSLPAALLGGWALKRSLVSGTRALSHFVGRFNQNYRHSDFYEALHYEAINLKVFSNKVLRKHLISNERSAVEDKAGQDLMTTAYRHLALKPGEFFNDQLKQLSSKKVAQYFEAIGEF